MAKKNFEQRRTIIFDTEQKTKKKQNCSKTRLDREERKPKENI